MRIFVSSVIVVLGVALVGCSSTTNPNQDPPAPPPPPSPSIAVSAPQDGTTVYGTPVKISITTANLSDSSRLSVRLNGTDITSKLSSADSKGVRSVQLSQPDITFGKNQIQARYQDVQASSYFTLNTMSGVGSGSNTPQGAVDPSTLLVGITTRVLQPGQTGTLWSQWGIQLSTSAGQVTSYWSNQPVNRASANCGDCSFGFQIVLLNRQDLHLVSNNSYETADPQEWAPGSPFVEELSSLGYGPADSSIRGVTLPKQQGVPGCQPFGCIVIMQSLAQVGSMPC